MEKILRPMKIIVVILAVFCAPPSFSNNLPSIPKTLPSLRIPLHTSTVSLDPTGVQDGASLWVSRQINCQLVRMSGREPKLEAASEIQFLNPTHLKITLKPDIHFHDGSLLTSEDVVASLEYLKSSRKVLRNIFDWMKQIRTRDEKTVEIELTQPVPQFLKFLGAPNYTIHPKDFLLKAKQSSRHWMKPIGCGGYRLSKWDEEAGVIHLDPVGKGRSLDFFFLESKKLDLARIREFDLLDSAFAQDLPAGKEFREAGSFDPKQVFVALNTRLKPWKSREARCQLYSEIDVSTILGAYHGKAEQARSLFPRGVLGFSPDAIDIAHPKMLRPPSSLITSDSKPFCVAFLGLSVPIELRESYLSGFKSISPSLRSIVIDDPKAFGPTFLKSGCDAFILGLKSNYLDGYEFLLPLAEPSANFTGYQDPTLAAMIRASQKINDSNQRTKVYQGIEATIHDRCLIRPLLTIPYRRVLVKKELSTPEIGEVPLNEYDLGAVQ